MDEQFDAEQIEIISPSAEEARDGYRRLQVCWPRWKRTVGLLVTSGGELAPVVSVIEYDHENVGFTLRLAVLEKLVAPSDFVREEYKVRCLWNQPYLSFDRADISAPYDFYLHFEQAGVERARELSKYLFDLLREPPGARMLRNCFGSDGPEFMARTLSFF